MRTTISLASSILVVLLVCCTANCQETIQPELVQHKFATDIDRGELASYYYFKDATELAQAGKCDESLENAKHGINSHIKIRDGCNFYTSGMIPNPPPDPLADGIVPSQLQAALMNCGRSNDVDSLLQAAVVKANEIYGRDSSVAVNQLYYLAVFRIKNRNEFEDLDQVLQSNPRVLDVGLSNSVLSKLYSLAEMLNRQDRPETAKTILSKILCVQRKSFDPDDLRLVKTLKLMAIVDEKLGNHDQALEYLSEAISVQDLYDDDVGSTQAHLCWLMSENLRKAGQTAESIRIKAILKSKRRPSPTPTAKSIKDVCNDSKLSVSTKIDKLRTFLIECEKQSKYSYTCAFILERLFQFAEQNEDWALMAEMASKRCKIYEHRPDVTAGRTFGCEPPQYRRMDSYSTAAKAYLKMDRKTEAELLLKRALSIMADLSPRELDAANQLLSACETKPQ